MYQDYTTKVIKTTGLFLSSADIKSTTVVSSLTNKGQLYATGGVNGVCRQFEVDSTNDNILLSFDGSLDAPDGSDFVAFVHTYADSTQLTGDIVVPRLNTAIVPFFNINGSGCFQGNVVIPKLQLDPNDRQYVLVGVGSISDKASPIGMYLDMKLHLQDQQVFQPSK